MLQKMQSLAPLPAGTEEYYRPMAKSLKPTFARRALESLDRSLLLIERNVNQKILFTTLVNQLYTIQNS